jgi:AraC-like DNA-binding protein
MVHSANALTGTALPFRPQGAPVPNPVSSGSLAAWQVKRTMLHIESNLETTLLASELAAIARLSVSHFSRAFRASFGQPPHTYVMARRIEKAKRLILSDVPIPLAEVALRCGLSDQAHLSKMFRKLVGESPAVWRRQYWWSVTVYENSNSAAEAATVSRQQQEAFVRLPPAYRFERRSRPQTGKNGHGQS